MQEVVAGCNVEEWRPIPGFEGLFLVSKKGRVRRIKTRYGNPCDKFMKLNLATSGYYRVSLANGVGHVPYVHSLVAAAFIGPRPSGLHINHIDGNKANNSSDNLEYMTCRENLLHAGQLGLNAIKLDEDRVRLLRSRYRQLRSFKAVSDEFEMHPSHVGRIVKREVWSYVED